MDSHIKISFDSERSTFNRFLDKVANANEIAPFKSKSKDYEWRAGLKVGDEVDACDTAHVWYNATVLNVRDTQTEEGDNIREAYIGYRVFREDGERQDAEGKHFYGWSSKYDEWLTVSNPRISPFATMAKKLDMKSSSNTDDPTVDDTNDIIYENNDNSTLYAITRTGFTKSLFITALINKFGARGGFETIIQRITDQNKWAPIETVNLMSGLVGNLYGVMHRNFAYEYIPRLKDAIFGNILKSPDSNIRNFSKDRIDSVINSLDSLLKRCYSIPEKNEVIETFNLQVCLICFEADFLDKKLYGLKNLQEIIKNMRYGTLKYLTAEVINKFIAEHNIFDKIFGSKGHVGLVQRSSDFLKYLINESSLDVKDLEQVWNATTKGDMETKLSVYKVLSDISLHFKNDHLSFLIKKISEIPPQDIISDEIELVYELSRYSLKATGFTKKARDFYWSIILDTEDTYTTEITELTLDKFCDIMKTWELREERMDVLMECIENLEKRRSILSSIRIMKKIIENYPSAITANEKLSKGMCMEQLC
jgi:hypothetical protein